MQFIHRGGVDGLGIAQGQKLRPARGQRVEAGNTGPALRNGIRIIEIEIVDEVVGRSRPQRVFASMRAPALSSCTVWL